MHVWWISPEFAGRNRSVKHWFTAFYRPTMTTVAAKALLSMLEADVIDASHLHGVLKAIGFTGPDDQEPPEAP